MTAYTMSTVPSLRDQAFAPGELNRDNWPIAAGLLQFPAINARDEDVRVLGPTEWEATFREVSDAGFQHIELTDVWLRPGELSGRELMELADCAREVDVSLPAIALIRRSVIDPAHGDANLKYSHASIDAAAALGIPLVSVGLHEALTDDQRHALWFWTRDGAWNDPDDAALWDRAVSRLRELGAHAAELGILLSLEMYEDTYLGSGASAVRLVEDIGLRNVGLNPDIGNLIRLHRPVEHWDALLHQVLPYTNYWHVKNYLRDEDPVTGQYFTTPISMELGLIDYRKAFRDAIGFGFAGVITCEHYGGDGLSVSATNRDYIRRLLPAGTREAQGK